MHDLAPAPGPTLPTVTARPLQRRLLTQCLVLAGLLHIAVVVVIGNSPGGSAQPGEGLWGSIQVRWSNLLSGLTEQ